LRKSGGQKLSIPRVMLCPLSVLNTKKKLLMLITPPEIITFISCR
jgi:hypothetical protein